MSTDGSPDGRSDGGGAFDLRLDGQGVGWLTFDQPDSPVNVFGASTMEELDRLISDVEDHAAAGELVCLVIRSGKDGFVAGADVHEIANLEDPDDAREKSRQGQLIFQRLADLPVPTVAVVHGICLGGGTELALACDHRLASDASSTKIGLPEVKLGILPAWGGSTRLPRLCGIQNALDMILTGNPVSAGKAARIGLVDAVAPASRLEREVAEFLEDVLSGDRAEGGYSKALWEKLLEDTPPGRALLFRIARKKTLQRTRGRYPAPLRALEVVEESYGMPVDRALEVEARALAELVATPEFSNLVRVFLLSQGVKKGLPEDVRRQARDVERVAVLGAGVMGGEIAEVVASTDVPVLLKDIEQEPLDQALRHARSLFDKAVRKGVFGEAEAGRKFALIQPTLEYDGLQDADLVIEAVVERMDVKKNVLREVEEVAPVAAVFATNTSSLSVEELASAASRPQQVVGLHFFNPAHKMPLVEVVRAPGSSERALATAFAFALALDKKPVVVEDAPGFLVNRLLAPYINEGVRLVAEGYGVRAVDDAITEFGMPMGPCRLLDEVGLDVAAHVRGQMEDAFGPRMSAPDVVDDIVAAGAHGKKSGRGFYVYEDGDEQEVNPDLQRRLEERRGADREGDPETFRRRCLYLMVNEAAHALEEEIVRSADDVDLALIMGTGFPPYRGGLLRWADREGLDDIVQFLQRSADRLGPRFEPAPRLASMARSGERFTDSTEDG